MNLPDLASKLIEYESRTYHDQSGKPIIDLDNKFVIFGIRGYTLPNNLLTKNDDKINVYNDSLILLRKTSQLECHSYNATLDPGLTWLRMAMNPLGTARLKEGLYKYKIGIHRGHPALNQDSQVTVQRYKEHSDQSPWVSWKEEKPSVFQTGWFGIDIHAKSTPSEEVNAASAGCSVIDSTWDGALWKEFFGFIHSVKATQSFYYYCVLDQATVDGLVQ
ncbi:hypothetical protein LEP1GSC050_1341 [Leptospira broomii serovar Hurstbridge str. 5399]|uniref:Uncharacterized protein n=1 Tax=Leptospira broomii serovar Hurstbridge str. 5399 TaxID=1049789 RepID=T0F859_9LEPT|nr:hypothetical protein [Leptospira broomii]EQA43687.1 hypothetical protein LEP1GSC050_1341 [Leptospira broomii serovar Hurstbridge str. 5399]